MSLDMFTRTQAERFQRHFALAGFGIEAQAALVNSRVVVIGAGALGSPVLSYLAAAGVGTIDLIDHDVVDRSNLHRQVIHSEHTLGQPKTSSATDFMHGLNPEMTVNQHRGPITAENALELIEPADVVVDGCDNFATRYVVADACEMTGKPLVSGSILRYQGQVSFFWSTPTEAVWPAGGRGPGYRDLYPEAPDAGEVPTCAEAGVLGVLPGVVGSIMATETVKFLTGMGESLLGRVLMYDALSMRFTELSLKPDPDRAAVTSIGADVAGLGGAPDVTCAVDASDAEEGAEQPASGAEEAEEPAEKNAEAPPAHGSESEPPADLDFNPFTGEPKQANDLTPRQLDQALAAGEIAAVVDVREPHEWQAGAITGALQVPMMDLAQSVSETRSIPGLESIDPEKPVVLYCAHGVRSRRMLAHLQQELPDAPVRSLLGGYELYRTEVHETSEDADSPVR